MTYQRRDEDNNIESPQPASNLVTDLGGSSGWSGVPYKDWNGNFTKRDTNNQIVSPGVYSKRDINNQIVIPQTYRRSTAENTQLLTDTLYAAAGQLPAFDLRFFNGTIIDAIRGITPTFTRPSSTKNVWNGTQFVSVAADVPAFQADPVTGRLGYLHEPAATNLYLNNGAPATQSITVTAVAHTLTFYGTGTITLSGASTAGPLVGTGAEPNRVSLTFTPSAGTLTLTLSGSISRPQLETGGAASSPIITAGSAVTRAADTMTVGGANFSSIYNLLGGTLYWEGSMYNLSAFSSGAAALEIAASAGANFFRLYRQTDAQPVTQLFAGGANQALFGLGATWTTVAPRKMAGAFAVNNVQTSINGSAPAVDTSATLPAFNQMRIGALNSGGAIANSLIYRLAYFPPGAAQSRIQQMTA